MLHTNRETDNRDQSETSGKSGSDRDKSTTEKSPSPVDTLQGRVGNQAVRSLVENSTIPPTNSPDEREAERAVQTVMQTADASKDHDVSTDDHSRKSGTGMRGLGTGRPLRQRDRKFFEPRFERDFGDVRIHTGPVAVRVARDLNARAFTDGRNIAFDSGEYRPWTSDGKRLLAHELAHVSQSNGGEETIRRQQGEGKVDHPKTASEMVDEEAANRPPVRFEPGVAAAVSQARMGINAGEMVLKSIEGLSDWQEDIAKQRLAKVTAETAVPEEIHRFIAKKDLRVGISAAVGLLKDFITVARLGDDRRREQWMADLQGHPLLAARAIVEFVEVIVVLPAICFTVIGAVGGAIWGHAMGLSLLRGVVSVLSSAEGQLFGKLVGAASSVLAIAHGALTMATAKSDEEFIAGAFETGAGAGGGVGLAAGSAWVGLGAGVALGGWLATGAWIVSKMDNVVAGGVSFELQKGFNRLGRKGMEVAQHATWVQAALAAWEGALDSGDWQALQASILPHVIRAGQHLANSLYTLLTMGWGPTGTTVNEYLVDAVGSPSDIPTQRDVELLTSGGAFIAIDLLRKAKAALRALERVFFDPTVRSQVMSSATQKSYERRQDH